MHGTRVPIHRLWISAIIGGSVMVLFCILQRKSVLYRYRLQVGTLRGQACPSLAFRAVLECGSVVAWALC